MPRKIALLFLLACGSCMEMKETVERMVVVRTTGSDLQPAATGYIYKKENDGEASVIKMGESEVMEHLTKLYEQPKAFAAPIPVANGPFYGKEDEDKAASFTSESKVIPVVEVQQDEVDGIANEEDGKIFGEYASDYGDYKSDFDEYLKSLGYFEGGLYHDDGEGKGYDGDEQKNGKEEEYETKENFKNGGAGDYHSEKYETYKVSSDGDGNADYDGDGSFHGKHYANKHGYNGDGHNYGYDGNQGETGDRFHTFNDEDEYKKNKNLYIGETLKSGHDFADGNANYGSDAGSVNGDFGARNIETHFGKGFNDRVSHEDQGLAENDRESYKLFHDDFAIGDGAHDGNSYGYKIAH